MDHQRNYVYPTSTRPIGGGHPPRSQALPPTTRRRPSSTNNLQKPPRRASMMRDTARANASARGISLLANAEDRRASLAKNSSSRRGDSFRANAKNRTSMRDSSHNKSMRDSSHNASFRGSLATSRRASVSASNSSLHHSSMKDFSGTSMRNLTDQQRVAIGRRRTQTLQDILLMDNSAADHNRRTSIMQLDHSGGTNTTSSSSDKAKRGKPERSRSRGSLQGDRKPGRSQSLRIPRNDSSHSMLDASIDLKLTNSKEQPLEVPATNKAKRSSMPNSRRSSLPKNSNHNHHHHKRSSLPTSASTPNLEQQQPQHRSSSIGGFSTEKFITDVTAPNRRRIGEKPTQETCDDGLFWIKRDGVKSFKKLKKSTSQPNAFLRRPSPSLKKKIYKGYLNWRQS